MSVEHWFDFVCPFCYVAQDRNRLLREHGIEVVSRVSEEVPWSTH